MVLAGVVGLVHVVDHPLDHLGRGAVFRRDGGDGAVAVVGHVVEGGDVDPLDLGGGPEEAGLVPPLRLGPAAEVHDLRQKVLPLPDEGHINKIRHRLGVVHGGAPGNDQGRQTRPVLPPEGDSRQVQHIQNGGIGHLVAHGKANDVKVPDGVSGLQGVEGDAGGAHLLLHVPPGGEGPLAPDPGHVVQNPVQDAVAQVGHADLICIGKAEGKTEVHLPRVLPHLVVFSPHVPGRLLDPGQDALQSLVHGHSPWRSWQISLRSAQGA